MDEMQTSCDDGYEVIDPAAVRAEMKRYIESGARFLDEETAAWVRYWASRRLQAK